ncbi:uncharacterized protein I303_107115 [Kwoniella dejecticola CBS 10117]|uniref:Uncharacterized protein n=1 Tax=Kwoniella dejecticola CBS 10117 TaxID=1296121 RepID=A0A1A5ZYS6_9TREE|nr:uncharacterized protein I303_06517 [Kwoniella dejecticola CBS 10117]OBR82959.1 hypothetical protein I303_06517 [Kwoniella dejecticola CBS 10117]
MAHRQSDDGSTDYTGYGATLTANSEATTYQPQDYPGFSFASMWSSQYRRPHESSLVVSKNQSDQGCQDIDLGKMSSLRRTIVQGQYELRALASLPQEALEAKDSDMSLNLQSADTAVRASLQEARIIWDEKMEYLFSDSMRALSRQTHKALKVAQKEQKKRYKSMTKVSDRLWNQTLNEAICRHFDHTLLCSITAFNPDLLEDGSGTSDSSTSTALEYREQRLKKAIEDLQNGHITIPRRQRFHHMHVDVSLEWVAGSLGPCHP